MRLSNHICRLIVGFLCWAGLIIIPITLLSQTTFAFQPFIPMSDTTTNDDTMMRRSSSLGEESQHDHYSNKSPAQRWRQGATQLDASSTSPDTTTTTIKGPRFTFGVIADIQYAPIPDGHSYSGQPRYYRHSLQVAKHAATHFEEEQVHLVVNLGDIIDGKCQDVGKHGGEEVPGEDSGLKSIHDAIESLSPYTSLILHTYGNHELYNLDRTVLGEKLNIPFVEESCGDLVGYRSHVVDEHGVRFVVLDTYDIALMKRCPKSSRKHKTATEILAKHNPNYPQQENSPEGMEGVNKRFVGFNGGVDQPQLEWLRTTLQQAREADEKVIILSHQPILPGSSSPVCLVWNYEQVLEVLREYSDVVVVSLAGHAHKGGYQRDEESGIHFRVIEAALESPSPIKTYGMVDMYDDRLVIRGFGHCESAEYDFDHVLSAKLQNATL